MPRARTRCNAAEHYRGQRKPICNDNHPCDACIDIYVRTKTEAIMHNDLHDDPMLIRFIAGNILEVLGQRQP